MSYQVKFDSSATNGVRINRRELQKLGSAGVDPWDGDVAYPKNKILPIMCYHVKFGSSTSKVVCINGRDPENWGALGPAPLRYGRG